MVVMKQHSITVLLTGDLLPLQETDLCRDR